MTIFQMVLVLASCQAATYILLVGLLILICHYKMRLYYEDLNKIE